MSPPWVFSLTSIISAVTPGPIQLPRICMRAGNEIPVGPNIFSSGGLWKGLWRGDCACVREGGGVCGELGRGPSERTAGSF